MNLTEQRTTAMDRTENTPARSGKCSLNNQELTQLIKTIWCNQGRLTPEILSTVAVGFKWDTYTVLNAVCNFINSSGKVNSHEDLLTITSLQNDKERLTAQVITLKNEYADLNTRSANISRQYYETLAQNCSLRMENEELKRRLKDRNNVEAVENLIKPLVSANRYSSAGAVEYKTPE
jgi:hypothetical protein